MVGNFVNTLMPRAAVAAAFCAVLCCGCADHEDFPDVSAHTGSILCTDGQVVSYDDVVDDGKIPIAVVFYVNTDETVDGDGYAVYLWDLDEEAFADTLGYAQGTSADVTALDGNDNTYAMYSCDDTGSPLADAVFELWMYGQSAYIPSAAQMRLLYAAKETVNEYIEKCGGDVLPDTPSGCWYWTSTEVEGQEEHKAWLYSVGSGAMQETPKDESFKARPIITLND